MTCSAAALSAVSTIVDSMWLPAPVRSRNCNPTSALNAEWSPANGSHGPLAFIGAVSA